LGLGPCNTRALSLREMMTKTKHLCALWSTGVVGRKEGALRELVPAWNAGAGDWTKVAKVRNQKAAEATLGATPS